MARSEAEETAWVCPDGHVIASSIPYSRAQDFCSECGKPAIKSCPECRSPIPGASAMWGGTFMPPKHCGSCGTAYPWTASAQSAARELIDLLDELTPDDREKLKGTLDDLMTDTARTEVAAHRFKLILKKAGQEGVTAGRTIATSLGTELAKRLILGGP